MIGSRIFWALALYLMIWGVTSLRMKARAAERHILAADQVISDEMISPRALNEEDRLAVDEARHSFYSTMPPVTAMLMSYAGAVGLVLFGPPAFSRKSKPANKSE